MKFIEFWRRKPRIKFNHIFKSVVPTDPKVILLYAGILHNPVSNSNQVKFTRYKRHEFEIKRVTSSKDLLGKFPISQKTALKLLESERRSILQEAFQRFFGVIYHYSDLSKESYIFPNQVNLTHTLRFGYYLESDTYLEICHFAFNANLKGYDKDFLAKLIGEFLVDWFQSYRTRVDSDGNLIQHRELTSVDLANKILWLTRTFAEYCWYRNGNRL